MMEAILGFLMIFFIGMLSLVGIFMISLKENTLDKILFVLIAFATGTIFATALFDLIPEALHHLEELNSEGANLNETILFTMVVGGYVVFFILERFLYWFHGHAHQIENELVCYDHLDETIDKSLGKGKVIKNFALLNLIGDGLHNFLDGVVIMVAFLSGIGNGVVVTLAVLFHELPQEIGDFGILLYGGFSKRNALLFNFLSAMVAMLGGIFAFFLSGIFDSFNFFFLAFSGGGFLYLASTELMPELLKQKDLKKSIYQALIFIVGLIVILTLITVLPHE
jgi:zinc and cadmium transporter